MGTPADTEADPQETEPDAADQDAADQDDAEQEPAPPRHPLSRLRFALVPLLALLLLLGGGGFLLAAAQLQDPAAAANRALTDAPATDRVVGDVSDTLTTVFSYSPATADSTDQAARRLLGGNASTQYQQLFGQVRQQLLSQKLTLTTRVVSIGVVRLDRDRARLLVFLDQDSQRAGAAATTVAAQLSVTARLENGHWRITDLTAR